MALSLENYTEEVREAIAETVEAFHLKVSDEHGNTLSVPANFQMLNDTPFPFRGGKASPYELQSALTAITSEYTPVDRKNLQNLIVAHGLGTDCSNFVYWNLARIHDRVGAGEYADSVFWDTDEVLELAAIKPGWELGADWQTALKSTAHVPAGQLAMALGKKPQYLIGTAHMSAAEAVIDVPTEEVLPGDVAIFHSIGAAATVHVAIVDQVEHNADSSEVSIWHSLWEADAPEAGVCESTIVMHSNETYTYSWEFDAHQRLSHSFVRPRALAALASNATLQYV